MHFPKSRKFGKQLQKRQLEVPEYAASFVNYKALKKLIKKLSATPLLLAQNEAAPLGEHLDPQASLQANKATFFFRLERELEKVNAFYLQKEAELKLRLKTLVDKKRAIHSRIIAQSKVSASLVTLQEGFEQFGNDLNKLQQFVEINATAFSKILKKWDKTSKSRTKELYLSRAVEVQPCFNRDVISDLSDQATTSLLELGAWSDGEKLQYEARPAEHVVSGQIPGTDENDIDAQILQAVRTGNIPALRDFIVRLKDSPDVSERFTRTFLASVNDAPDESLAVLLETNLVDLHAQEDINERNCLHEAAMYGREYVLNAAIAAKVDVSRVDVYGRTPLHYASMNGRVDALQTLVAAGPRIIDTMDHDNFTPLILAIVHHQLPCVQRLLSFRARVDPSSESDHIPLNLACQHGSVPIVELLLQNHAAVLPDAEGLYPQHLVARSGKSPELLLMLREYGADLDQLDKLYQWTPLFHAASEGHLRSLQVLLECGVRPDINDEKGLSAVYYAAWEGHLQCMRLLAAAGVKAGLAKSATPLSQASTAPAVPASSTPAPMAMEHDAIPDLSLPPPIIPLRRYGHNFLDSKTFVAISFEEAGAHAIRFFHDSKYPAARLTITSKLSDLIPRNVLIPIQEDSRVISFQIDNLDLFTVDFDIFPTFGSKVIARSIALPNNFNSQLSSTGHCCLPLFDPRLRAIGQISFNYQVIKPFHGIPLEITDFATYWKATSQRDEQPSAFITGSSLSGEYVRLFVQLTNDGVPVLCPQWTVNLGGIEFSVGRLTYEQFVSIGAQRDQGDENLAALANWETQGDITKIHQVLATSFASLKDALAVMPPNLHVELHVLFPSATEEHLSGLGPTPNINDFADAILSDVFDHARQMRERSPDALRSIVFTSFNSNICAALNWKQPNYPVLLCNNLGSDPASLVGNTATVQSSGQHSISVKEAVRIAQGNNFMGLVCCSRLLDMVPALIEAIKSAGLVLVSDTSEQCAPYQRNSDSEDVPMPPAPASNNTASSAWPPGHSFHGVPDGIDGVLKSNGILKFNETIDM